MIKRTILAFVLFATPTWSPLHWIATSGAGSVDGSPRPFARLVSAIGDSPEPIPPKR